jgi:hypothetical protein
VVKKRRFCVVQDVQKARREEVQMGPERLRDEVHGEVDASLLETRRRAGWQVAVIEWERDATPGPVKRHRVEVPFGLRIASDCSHLEADETETEVLRTVMRGVVNDRPLSAIAQELNGRGFRTRTGEAWNPAKVFRLMPAVIENGPRIVSSPEWPAFRDL